MRSASQCLAAAIGLALASAAWAQSPAPASGQVPIPRSAFLSVMDAEFARMDADKNKIVTRAEIEQAQRAAAAAQAQTVSRALFARLDTDKNGQLSPAEFAKLQVTASQPNAAPVLAQGDLNKDGSITLVEYRTAKLANFDRTDTDKDGIVSPAEMKAAGLVK